MIFHILATFLFVKVVTCASGSYSEQNCQRCHAFGATHLPNREFTHTDGCRKYVCDCKCDGSYECPAGKIIDVCQTDCTTCLVGGEVREGNRPFQWTDECAQYKCFCNCDGSWNCPKEDAVDICNTNLTTGCYYCDVHGQKFQGNSFFKHTDGCIEYSCTCNCDGSWNCPGELAVDKCNTNPDTGCYYCTVEGDRHEGNSYFKHVNGCVEYRCVCNCDGSWNCPGEDAVDVCRTNLTTGCFYCEADDYLYQGNSRFPLVRDCYLYHCTCACDGGWTCKDSIGQYICDANGNVPEECETCNIHGNIFRGDSRFFYQSGCIKYMCTCDCQGRHRCLGDDARNICPGSDDTEITSLISDGSDSASSYERAHTRSPRQTTGNCVPCVADKRSYRAGEEFQLVQGCTIFTCNCFCDGHYDCPSYLTRRKPECKGPSGGGVVSVSTDTYGGVGVSTCRKCEYKEYTYRNGPAQIERGCWQLNCECHCNGTLECPSNRSEWICGGRPECSRCQVSVDGESYGSFEPKADFQITHNNINYNCTCYCDGGWKCNDGEYVNDPCSGCEVDGDRYPGDSSFQLTRGCDLYKSCYCSCGGEWNCSAEGIEDVCGLCRKCKIGEDYYEGDTSSFEATIGYVRYRDCSCDCDGKWECRGGFYTRDRGDQPVGGLGCGDCVIGRQRYRHGQTFNYQSDCTQYRNCECRCGDRFCRNVKDTCGNCRSCEVEGNKYEVGEKFSLKQECIIYRDCSCACDGTWRCSGENAIDTCYSCKKCNFEGTLHEPYSHFTEERKCWRYQCFCGCDGSISCPSITAVNICNVPDDCGNCEVLGATYQGNTHFQYQLSGLTMSCRCNCDRSYICIAEWIHWVKEAISISGSGIGSGAGSCLTCSMNNRYYKGNSNYTITKAGVELECQCFCNGGYYCRGEKLFEDQRCRRCSIFGQRYEGDSTFPLIFRGLKVSCTCSCDGSYVCFGADQMTVISCVGGSGCLPSTCSRCVVDGVGFNGGDTFGTVYKGTELRCECGCDGSYYCEGSGGVILSCFGGRCRELGCSSCTVFGNIYAGDSSFEIVYKGLKLGCRCECGGNYQCTGSDGSVIASCIDGGAGCLPSICGTCYVNGQQHAGGSKFRYVYNGIDMQCTCGCDSSYFCSGITEFIEISCIGGTCYRIGCQTCNVFGQSYEGDTSFDIVYSGVILRCQCSCDSSYRCADSSGSVTVVCVNGRGCLPSTCRSCIVNGLEYAGRSTFRSTYKGIDITCTCGCDGSSHCVGVTTSIEVSCIDGVCSRIGCGECSIFGTDFLGNSQFDIIYQGLKVTCSCDCDGSYVCRDSTGRAIITCANGIGCLPSVCRPCVVDGRTYQGTSNFRYVYNDIDMQCNCGCDGSYFCEGVRENIQISCFGGTCNPVGCKSCRIFNQDYAALSSFNLVYGGTLLDCKCDCDGDYRCMGESGIVIVQCIDNRGCLPELCQRCTLNGREYAGRSTFRFDYNGYDVNCQCGCDGSVYCTGVSTEIIISCIGGICNPVGCQSCRVYGRDHPGLSQFDIIYNGLKLTCRCDCLGGYICQGDETTTTITCKDARGCLPQECQTCNFNGRSYRGRAIFKYSYKNIDFSCTCGCDGSVFCEGIGVNTVLRCINGECTPIGCRNCNVFGREYSALSQFDIIYQGVRLGCSCDCLGGYICRGSTGVTVVECLASGRGCLSNTCNPCVRRGRTYRAGDRFRDKYQDIDVECTCSCDGSSFCSGIREFIEIACVGENCSPINCRNCNIFGYDYASLSTFNMIYKGVRINCRCSCDGSYICTGSTGDRVVECLSDGRGCLPSTCRNCVVNGREYRARTMFPSVYKGIDMNCHCGCDGSAFCEGITEVITISCIDNTCSPVGCRNCNIFGREYAGDSEFEIIYRGVKMQCDCKCDTSYRCIGSTGDSAIDCRAGRRCLPNKCRKCRVNGVRHPGNSRFKSEYQGIPMDCVCGCDGSYFCQGTRRDIQISCPRRGSCSQIGGCRSCSIFGIEFEGNTRKSFVYQGYNMDCECSCDSSYRCVGTKGEITTSCEAGRNCLPPPCRSCRVEGKTYQGNSRFTIDYKGITMNCVCGCDSSYFCQGTQSDIQIACPRRGDCTQIGCRSCNIFGIEFEGNSRKDFVYQGFNMTCECSCDSSYRCIGTKGEVTTFCAAGRNCLPPPCMSCNVGGRTYPGNSRFSHVYKGIQMSCVCGCDSSYFCQGQQTDIQLSCNRRGDCTQIGCRSCNIFGIEFEGNSQKDFVYQGYNMNCQCACDGSYRCIGTKGDVTTSCAAGGNCLPPPCRSCRVDGRTYPGNSRFSHVYKGIQMSCVCGCDSSYFCQGQQTDIQLSCNRRGDCTQIGCRSCNIFGIEFEGNSQKDFVYQGYNMNCQCACDGSYRCIGTKGDVTTSCAAGGNCLPPPCRSCRVDGRTYPGNSRFSHVYKGIQMSCVCGCDSSYFCQGQQTDIQLSCPRRGDCTQIGCRNCNIFGIEFEGNSQKDFVYQGYNMNCQCACDGSYRCIGTKGDVTTSCAAGGNCLPPPCRSCRVDGRTYPGNSRFSHVYKGIQVNCVCGCDSSYFCQGQQTDIQLSCPRRGDCTQIGCRNCNIFGIEFEGNSQKDFVYQGYNMNCQCACDGSYRCIGTKGDVTTSCAAGGNCLPPPCRSCRVDGRTYPGNSRFSHVYQGIQMDCVCGCDSSYFCRGVDTNTEISCLRDGTCVPVGCRTCLSDGRERLADTEFEKIYDGIRMNCYCNCDGSYKCQGVSVTITISCTGEACSLIGCRSCLYNNREYRYGTEYEKTEGNLQYRCQCQCDGSSQCEVITPACQTCLIDGQRYEGDTRFRIFRNRNLFICSCDCNGRHECLPERPACRSCEIFGSTYGGNRQFKIEIRGIEYDCTCNCNGTWRCISDVFGYSCEGNDCGPSDCRSCFIDGRSFKGDTSFTDVLFGDRMNCRCSCDGGYRCESESQICSSISGCQSKCRECDIEGRRYPGNSASIQAIIEGRRMICQCDCNGRYRCEGGGWICSSLEGCVRQSRCAQCEIDGKRYAGDTSFEIDHSMGIRMHCECRCDGGYTCNGTKETTTCIGSGCDTTGCLDCIVDSVSHPGGTTFEIDRNGIRMTCSCDCNGGYQCRGEETVRTCEGPGCDGQCGPCVVDGRNIQGNTRFELVRDGVNLQCICRCDGGYSCEGTKVCSGSGCRTTGCKRCTIDGVPYTGNTRFTVQLRGIDWECTCYCDGSYSCTSPTGIVQSCIGSSCAADQCRNCVLDGKEYELDSRFRLQKNDLIMNCVCECDGAYRCFSITGTCVGPECDEYGCKSCIIDGNTYQGNREHTIRRGGRDVVCTCECSGHFTCRHATLQLECKGADCGIGGCRQCYVDREVHEGNSRFRFTKYGLTMECACNCDSSFTCRGYQIISSGSGPFENTCGTCEINGNIYNGNTRFQAMINGVRSICSCECNGRYTCQGATHTCRPCVIGSDRYQGNSDFVLRRDGHSINCKCDCNGDFVCVGRQGEPSVIGGCRDCIIFGTRYKGDTRFTTDARGIRMLCECFCNGGYSCKGYRTVSSVTLPSERRTTCATCYVGDRTIQGNTQFQIQRGCFLINCICKCEGDWECPTQVPTYTCSGNIGSTPGGAYTQERYSIAGSHIFTSGLAETDSRTVITSSEVFGTDECRSCFINNQEYTGNTEFTLQDGCLRFSCACDCSGGWNCSRVEGSDCTELSSIFASTSSSSSSGCVQCDAFGSLHAPNTKFAAQDECYLYSCFCNCNGSWQCPSDLTVKTCVDSSSIHDPAAGTCRKCVIGENSYDYRESFELTKNCIRYKCVCGCDGSYDCPSTSATRVCRFGSGLPGRIPSYSSGVGRSSGTSDRGSGRTVVNIRPSGGTSSSSSASSSSSSRRVSSSSTRVSSSSSTSRSSSRNTGSRSVSTSTRRTGGGSSSLSTSTRRTGGSDTSGSTSYEARRTGSSTSRSSGSVDLGSLLSGSSCKDCVVDDQRLEGGRDFTYRSGCTEFLCECFCNGTYVCPPERSTNFCDDKLDMADRKGCTVGRRTYNTKLFSYTEDCIKYICRCYDNGSYHCDPNKTRQVC